MPRKGVRVTSQVLTSEMGQRVSLWLRAAFPRHGAKRVAKEFEASHHTARRWFEGHLPENRHMAEMARRWGGQFLAFVFEPAIGPGGALGLDQELQDLRDRLARLEADVEQARAASPARANRMADSLDVRPGRAVGGGDGRGVARPLAPMERSDR